MAVTQIWMQTYMMEVTVMQNLNADTGDQIGFKHIQQHGTKSNTVNRYDVYIWCLMHPILEM